MEVSQRLKKDPRFIPNLHYPRVLRLEKAKHHWFNVDLKPPLYVTFMSNFLFFLNIMLYNQLSQHTLRTNVYYFCSGFIRNLNWWVPKYYSKGLPKSRFSLKSELIFVLFFQNREPTYCQKINGFTGVHGTHANRATIFLITSAHQCHDNFVSYENNCQLHLIHFS